MAPAKTRSRRLSTKSTSKQAVSEKKPLRKKKGISKNAKMPQETVSEKKIVGVSDKKMVEEDKQVADAKESVPNPPKRKPCTWLKLDRVNPQVGSKSSVQGSKEAKEAKEVKSTGNKTQNETDHKRKRKEKNEEKGNKDPKISENHIESCPEEKEKGISHDRQENQEARNEFEKKLGGLIFMCNNKTKADCFNYQLMGNPAGKKDVVLNIKPGLKLFLYDYDLKLLYGIFEASSAGGMKLEPTAFGGGFPAQVRFAVIEECLPLPESIFKKAIKESYDERTRKFKNELTMKQVKKLIGMFHPTPWLHPYGRPLGAEGNPICGPVQPPVLLTEGYPSDYGVLDSRRTPIPLHVENQLVDHHGIPNLAPRDSLYLTEQEYINNGLLQRKPLASATACGEVGHPVEPSILDQELKHLLRNPSSSGIDSGVQQQEALSTTPNFPSEMEYRIYGLRAPQQIPNVAPPRIVQNSVDVCDPYNESTTSLVNRYLAMPRATAAPADPYPLPSREAYTSEMNRGRPIPGGERVFVGSYTLGEQSDFNHMPYSLRTREPSCTPGETSAPVSQRYSFAGPSLMQQR